MRGGWALAGAALLWFSAPAAAQEPEVELRVRPSPAFAACTERANGVTADTLRCIGAEHRSWDARLNAAYRALLNSDAHSGRAKNGLREAQRRWISFRDASCAAEGDLAAEGGTLATVLRADCALRRTAQRAAELEAAASARR